MDNPPVSDDLALNEYEEQMGYLRIESSLRNYGNFALQLVEDKRRHYKSIAPHHKPILPNYEEHFDRMVECVRANNVLFQDISDYSQQCMFWGYWPNGCVVKEVDKPTALDVDKVLSTLRQFVRDWSAEGQPERDACYGPILTQLEACFPDTTTRGKIKVLVPGSGLSRLAYEIFVRGFFSQGSEFSHHMLICGSYILNHIPHANAYTIYPFVHNITNNRKRDDPLRPIMIPDEAPLEACSVQSDSESEEGANVDESPPKHNPRFIPGGNFSMCAGGFVEVYSRPREIGAWQAVVTCFFIDTAHDIFEYVETLSRMLEVGGVWLNLGPLLWHFADQMTEKSIELSWDDVRQVIIAYGFDILEERDVRTTYTVNCRGLMQQHYTAIYMYAVKTSRPIPTATGMEHPTAAPMI